MTTPKFPTPGFPHMVGRDSTIEEIAEQAYGTTEDADLIWGANPSRTTNIVKAGETFVIPGEPPPTTLVGKQPNEMTFIVAGVEIPMVAARIIRTMDTGTSGWVGRFPWTPGKDRKVDEATAPYGYGRAAAYIGNKLLVSGLVYIVEPEMTNQGMSKVLSGFSFTADAVDSNLQPPYEYNGVSLEQLAPALAALHGIKAVFNVDTGGPFERVTGHESDTVFAFLSKLATERGLLVGDTPEGDMIFQRANTEGGPVGTINEDGPFAVGWKATYDGRKRYNAYKCITQGAEAAVPLWGQPETDQTGPTTKTSVDPAVPRSRFLTFRADDTTPANVENAARWRKNKQFIEALAQPLKVAGWYAPNGKLWQENTLVTVVSPTLGVPTGFTFLIRSVEFILEENRSTVLQLVPPEAYTGKDIGEVWALEPA